MVTTPSFGAWLKQRRRSLDLTQEELAGQVGCSVETIYKIEANARRPSKQIAERLAGALGLSPGEKSDFIRFARGGLPWTSAAPPAPQPGALDLPPGAPSSHLPAPPTTLVGRAEEIAALTALLRRPEVRLLTLTGPGGIGKTRLALEVARAVAGEFPDGVVFVPLTAISNPQMVIWVIAQTLGVHEHGGRPVEELLKTMLGVKNLLLLLDNFEQVLAAASAVAELLAAAPGLKVLVTSRALLHLYGEHEYAVPPLALPDACQTGLALDQLTAFCSIGLFVERACAIHKGFQLTAENAPAVIEICRRLDGLPLAIELVTAQIKYFSPQALLARLHKSALALLTNGPQDLPDRQRTLRAAIAWSYELLAPQEQLLLARVGVFAGGCTIEAAEAVCNAEGRLDVFDGLPALADQSLLVQRQEPDGEPRFFLLETIREYALEQLTVRSERAELEQRYADYYVALAERAEPELAYEIQWVQLLEREYNNLRAVLGWSVAQARRDVGMRLSGALWRFWYMKGQITEGRLWFDRVLDESDAIAPAIRAKAIDGAGVMAMFHGQYMEAQRHHETALRLYRELGEPREIAGNLESLGHVRLYLGDYEQALVFYGEGLKIRREANDLSGIASSLNDLGGIALFQGDFQKAQKYMEETLHISRAIGDIPQTVMMLSNLATLAYYQKQFGHALQLYQESLSMNRQVGRKRSIAACLEGVALILAAKNNLAQALTLFGAARQVRETTGLLVYNQFHDIIRRTIEEGQQRLGDDWELHWQEGRARTLDHVISDVLSMSPSDIADAAKGLFDAQLIVSKDGPGAHQLLPGDSTG